jgi:aryl-alcohol dehydrogenase-like predicted oxidoreductase
MAEALGLAVTAWSPLGGGLLSGKYRRGGAGRLTAWGNLIHAERGPREGAILDAVHIVAEETGATQAQVAVAWMRAKGLFPILGPRTRAQLDDNLGALAESLTADQLRRLDGASAVPLGFPHDLLADERNRARIAGGRAELLERPARAAA